jgi:hypothetical protein
MPCNRIFVISELTLVIRAICSECAARAADAETRIALQKSQRAKQKRNCDRSRMPARCTIECVRGAIDARHRVRSRCYRPIDAIAIEPTAITAQVFFVSSPRADVRVVAAQKKFRSRPSSAASGASADSQDFDGLGNG